MSQIKVPFFVGVFVLLQLSVGGGFAEPIRIAMPSKSLTFLNYYLAERFGLFKYEGLEASFPVGKADVQLTAVVTGEMEYIAAVGTVLRGAATGLPVKAVMFALDKPIFFKMVKPETKRIQDLKGKAVAVTALAATDALGARAMAKAAGMNPDQDLVFLSAGNTANALAALQAGSAAAAMLSIPLLKEAHRFGWQVMHVRKSKGYKKGKGDEWTTSTSIPGWRDLVLFKPGQMLFRELKANRGYPTPEQRQVLADLAAAGADVGVWKPKDWVTTSCPFSAGGGCRDGH